MTLIDIGVDFTIFEVEELDNDETIYTEFTRDLESDWRYDFRDLSYFV